MFAEINTIIIIILYNNFLKFHTSFRIKCIVNKNA